MRWRAMRLATRGRVWTGAILTLLLLHLSAPHSIAAGEIIPSLGVTKPVDGGDAKLSGNLALRGHLLPILMTEVGVGYRSEDRFDDQLHIRQWPITASVYLSPPSSVIYAGAGAGWYHTSFDYEDDLLFEDETKQEFGVHLGGGLQIPLGGHAGLDLNGRYVMMRDQEAKLVPEKFDPDFWTTTLGLAIKF